MIPPAVAVEIAAPDAASPHVAVLLEACSRAAAGPCAKAADPGAESAATTAIVSWEGSDRLRARVEVGTRTAGKGAWQSRALSFRAEDAEVERWRTVGLVIATLASGAPPEESPAAATPEPAPPEPAPQATPARPPDAGRTRATPPAMVTRWPWVWIDGAVVAGPATDDGGWRVGGLLRGEVAARSVPALALLSLRYAAHPAGEQDVAVQWASAAAGFGVHLAPTAEVRLQGRLELGAELVAASVADDSGTSDSGSRWVAAARAGVDGAWMWSETLGLVGGVDATIAQSGTLVRLRGDRALRALPFTISPSLGLRLSL